MESKKRYDERYDMNANGLNLPYSLEAEQAVLGSILIEDSTINNVADVLKQDHFYVPEHRAIYRVMIQLMMENKKIDFVTVLSLLKADGVYSGDDGKSYLMQLVNIVPSINNIDRYVAIVKEKYDIRRLIQASRKILDEGMDPAAEFKTLIDVAEQRIFDIREGHFDGKLTPIGETIASNYEMYNSMSNPEERALLVGIPTGMPEVDQITTGLNRDNLIVIGARPGVGKSSFILNIARNIAVEQKKTVAIFNLEMSKEQMVTRLLSSEAKVSGKRLSIGALNPAEWGRIANAASTLTAAPIYLDDTPSVTVQDIKARVRRIPNVSVVFIDYLQLMHSANRTENRVQEVSEVTRSLKIMAKELHIPVVVCAQLTRGSEKARRPSLPDLRESGSIEQDADQVMFIYREEMRADQEEDVSKISFGTGELIVAKNRHGETGTVNLSFEGEFTQFKSKPKEISQD